MQPLVSRSNPGENIGCAKLLCTHDLHLAISAQRCVASLWESFPAQPIHKKKVSETPPVWQRHLAGHLAQSASA